MASNTPRSSAAKLQRSLVQRTRHLQWKVSARTSMLSYCKLVKLPWPQWTKRPNVKGIRQRAWLGEFREPWNFREAYLDPVPGAKSSGYEAKVFWTGFSHTIGTRPVVDIFAAAVHGRDVEHEETPIGQVMRKLDWDRPCHNTHEDSDFWKVASQAFAFGNADRAIGSSIHKGFYFLLNHETDRLRKSFLMEYESDLIHDGCVKYNGPTCYMILVDFQNSCRGEAMKELETKLTKLAATPHLACLRPGRTERAARKKSKGWDVELAGMWNKASAAVIKIWNDKNKAVKRYKHHTMKA